MNEIKQKAESKRINLRYYDDGQHVGISLDETITARDVKDLLEVFESNENFVIQHYFNNLFIHNILYYLFIRFRNPF